MAGSDGAPADGRDGRPGANGDAEALEGRPKSAVLWGLAGALLFGVLYQGYVLAGADWAWAVLVGGMVVVGAVTTLLARRFEARLGVDDA